MLAVKARDRSLAGGMGKPAEFRPPIERLDRIGRERPVGHARDVERRGRIGLRAIRPADGDAEIVRVQMRGGHRVVDPFMADLVDVEQRAERAQPLDPLGAAIDERALLARIGGLLVVALEEILPDLGAEMLEDEAQPRRDRIVLEHRAAGLEEIVKPDQRDDHRHPGHEPADKRQPCGQREPRRYQGKANDERNVTQGCLPRLRCYAVSVAERAAKTRVISAANSGRRGFVCVCHMRQHERQTGLCPTLPSRRSGRWPNAS